MVRLIDLARLLRARELAQPRYFAAVRRGAGHRVTLQSIEGSALLNLGRRLSVAIGQRRESADVGGEAGGGREEVEHAWA